METRTHSLPTTNRGPTATVDTRMLDEKAGTLDVLPSAELLKIDFLKRRHILHFEKKLRKLRYRAGTAVAGGDSSVSAGTALEYVLRLAIGFVKRDFPESSLQAAAAAMRSAIRQAEVDVALGCSASVLQEASPTETAGNVLSDLSEAFCRAILDYAEGVPLLKCEAALASSPALWAAVRLQHTSSAQDAHCLCTHRSQFVDLFRAAALALPVQRVCAARAWHRVSQCSPHFQPLQLRPSVRSRAPSGAVTGLLVAA